MLVAYANNKVCEGFDKFLNTSCRQQQRVPWRHKSRACGRKAMCSLYSLFFTRSKILCLLQHNLGAKRMLFASPSLWQHVYDVSKMFIIFSTWLQ